ncbi:Rha family transcriptional regulator [Morganella morganii]|uniref:Rha family transcriptional regulator n=1 Tax=Morganella morganii TaxID=582 RepID=UPI001BDA8FC2|nr:Rha family transcriptional regulator [Morganella morganii]EKL3980157.1 Rha family transcriptional regulator [Morganella morganii]EKU5843267.1 Rha family transcriptional regulator [Morganella morganii]ELB1016394.1 Rha family transcriptional regulator [Morganella morganii]MBT0403211.1 Rha family transcriptional regulator [Morganella morganii subsp. morganii]MCF1266567.1 Rha family transcriptional regulator [Morganella morganii]
MNELISTKASMTSIDIAELVGSRHDKVKQSIERLAERGIITLPPMGEKPTSGRPVTYYIFEGEEGKRDSIIVVAQLSPEFTARLVDRWKELEQERTRPKSQAELIAAMAMANLEQERRMAGIEQKVVHVAETVEQIKKGSMREGYAGFSQLKAKSGLTDAKCRTLVKQYQIPTDTHEFLTPDGLLSRRAIVAVQPFMNTLQQVMKEAERRGTKWYHPNMGLFQAIGWEEK